MSAREWLAKMDGPDGYDVPMPYSRMLTALRAVLALHKTIYLDGKPYCCSECHRRTSLPCPTVKAIEEALR